MTAIGLCGYKKYPGLSQRIIYGSYGSTTPCTQRYVRFRLIRLTYILKMRKKNGSFL